MRRLTFHPTLAALALATFAVAATGPPAQAMTATVTVQIAGPAPPTSFVGQGESNHFFDVTQFVGSPPAAMTATRSSRIPMPANNPSSYFPAANPPARSTMSSDLFGFGTATRGGSAWVVVATSGTKPALEVTGFVRTHATAGSCGSASINALTGFEKTGVRSTAPLV